MGKPEISRISASVLAYALGEPGMLRIECQSCKAPYQVDERRVPPTGLKMRCPKCGHTFLVKADGSTEAVVTPGSPAKAPPLKPGTRAPTQLGIAPTGEDLPAVAAELP